MSLEILFPTPIVVESPSDENKGLLFDIKLEVDSCLGKILTNDDYTSLSDVSKDKEYGNVHNRKQALKIDYSSFTGNVIQKYSLSSLMKHIQSTLQKYVNVVEWSYGTDPRKNNEGLKIGMLDSWFNITEKNQKHQMHIHPHHTISGVYYHQMKKEMGGIIFRNPNPFVANHLFPEGPTSPNMITFVPEEGTLILFPSWLEHGTEDNQTDEDRISISFNIDIF